MDCQKVHFREGILDAEDLDYVSITFRSPEINTRSCEEMLGNGLS
jgi:hypothetical protein